jgi:predicted RNA binding protein YcfA (HicA-like mRNA interferase family)
LRHPSQGGLVTVPVHGNETLDIKVIKSILTQADPGIDELKGYLR